MSQSGSLAFFSEARLSDPKTLIESALAYIGADHIRFAARYDPAEVSWERYLAERDQPWEDVEAADGAKPFAFDLPVAQVPALFDENTVLHLDFPVTRLEARLAAPLRERVPDSIRAGFTPCQPVLRIGRHDLFEAMEHPDGYLIGRAWFTFELFSYDVARDCEAYRRLVFGIPEIKQVKREIETFAGPLEQCVYWSG